MHAFARVKKQLLNSFEWVLSVILIIVFTVVMSFGIRIVNTVESNREDRRSTMDELHW